MRLFSIISLLLLAACSSPKQAGSSQKEIITSSGLRYMILQKGDGPAAKAGNEVMIYETTTYVNGTILYSNENTNRPVKVLIGGGQATAGVDEGLRGMQVGEIRRLILSPNLSKRTSYPDNISPDSTIVVKILLHKIL